MDPEYFVRYITQGKLNKDSRRDIDDFVDRLNYRYTSVILAIMTGVVGMRQYIGKQIECWIPQEFTKSWEEYAESYCFVSSTYFNSVNRKLPDPRYRIFPINYYQWAPIFLLGQIIICVFPHFLWKFLIDRCGIGGLNCRAILSIGADCNEVLPKELARHSTVIANYIMLCLDKQNCVSEQQIISNQNNNHDNSNNNNNNNNNVTDNINDHSLSNRPVNRSVNRLIKDFICCSLKPGRRLFGVYMTVKVLSMIELCIQIVAMEKFIGTHYYLYGIRILYDFARGFHWQYSGHFPRVTFCDFEAKKIGENDPYTLQCVLPLNMFLEKIFIFLWLWFAILLTLTVSSAVYWIIVMQSARLRQSFVRSCLGWSSSTSATLLMTAATAPPSPKPSDAVRDSNSNVAQQTTNHYHQQLSIELITFTEHYLQQDGVFLNRLIGLHCGHMLLGEVVSRLWANHLSRSGSLHIFFNSNHQKEELFLSPSIWTTSATAGNSQFPGKMECDNNNPQSDEFIV